ncbi:hypothetical protein B0H11DRAFT_2050298 [Mycena galericulata]|nr:hypothetical protein B0H11DRAFT_2050298 [Mycena galericulata]
MRKTRRGRAESWGPAQRVSGVAQKASVAQRGNKHVHGDPERGARADRHSAEWRCGTGQRREVAGANGWDAAQRAGGQPRGYRIDRSRTHRAGGSRNQRRGRLTSGWGRSTCAVRNKRRACGASVEAQQAGSATRGPLECSQPYRKASHAVRDNERVGWYNERVGRCWSPGSGRSRGRRATQPTERYIVGERTGVRAQQTGGRSKRHAKAAWQHTGAAPSERVAYLIHMFRYHAWRHKGEGERRRPGAAKNALNEPTPKKAPAASWSPGAAITCWEGIEMTSRKIFPPIQEERSRGGGAGGRGLEGGGGGV